MAPIEVVDALKSAAIAIDRARDCSDDADVFRSLPLAMNTFFNLEEEKLRQVAPNSLSCPPAMNFSSPSSSSSLTDVFSGTSELSLGDLASAAKMFSKSLVTREFMESIGHVGTRTVPPQPLSEPELPDDLSEPEAPVWIPTHSNPLNGRPTPPPLSYPETPLSNLSQVPFQVSFSTPKVSGSAPAQPAAASPVMPPISPPLPGGFAYALQFQRAAAMYRVSHSAGVESLKGPSFDAPKTGVTLYCDEIFAVSETIPASDGRIYLLLADGRGWVFDDSALNPHCPSVVFGQWVSVTPAAMTSVVSPASTLWEPMEEPTIDVTKKRRRRKQRGARRNKNKKCKA